MNVEKPLTMIPTIKTIRAPFIALMTITMLVYSGCKPTGNKETAGSDNTTSQPRVDEVASSSTDVTDPEAGGEPVRIDGDLSSIDWRSMLGQEVTITGDLVVVDTYDLVRRGQVKVARDRLYIPTNRIDPNDADPDATSFEGGSNVGKVTKAQKYNDEATIIIEDGSTDENVFPPTLFPNLGKTVPTVRIGSVLQGVSGKLVKERNKIVLVPNGPLQWTPAQRPQRPSVGEANVTVASFNVLNYFTTIDNGRNNARGADSESELKRQEAKLVSAIIALKADVIGLMELENNLDSENRLVTALNREIGKDVFKGCRIPDGFREAPGGQNAIRVGIIYRTDRVAPVGEVSMIRDDAFEEARTPIVQRFTSKTTDNPFAVIVNHFKAKGGSDRADVANKNKGDGQGAYNATRRSQALAICNYIDELKRHNKEPRVLVIGDLNAYGQEDPIDAMRAKGLVDLQERFGGRSSSTNEAEHYSFIYYGQCGSLDHAMATEPLAADVKRIATWHINADEPRFLDYNEEHNPKMLYEANPFRSSDHDPVLIGIGN
jgi:predicted extracellular nuclease